MAAGKDSEQVTAGPGLIYVAALGTTEPTSVSSALDAGFKQVGYTTEGLTFTYEITNEAIEVAEEFDPIRYQTTGRNGTVAFTMAQASIGRLALALNSGAALNDSQATYEPPEPGEETRVMILHQGENGGRILFRQCINASSIEMAFKKAPDLNTIPVEFRLEKPTGVPPFKVWGYGPDGLIA